MCIRVITYVWKTGIEQRIDSDEIISIDRDSSIRMLHCSTYACSCNEYYSIMEYSKYL